MSKKVLLIVFAVGFLATGCTLPTTKYEVSVDNVQQLKRAGKTRVHVGKFTVAPENEKKFVEVILHHLTTIHMLNI